MHNNDRSRRGQRAAALAAGGGKGRQRSQRDGGRRKGGRGQRSQLAGRKGGKGRSLAVRERCGSGAGAVRERCGSGAGAGAGVRACAGVLPPRAPPISRMTPSSGAICAIFASENTAARGPPGFAPPGTYLPVSRPWASGLYATGVMPASCGSGQDPGFGPDSHQIHQIRLGQIPAGYGQSTGQIRARSA